MFERYASTSGFHIYVKSKVDKDQELEYIVTKILSSIFLNVTK